MHPKDGWRCREEELSEPLRRGGAVCCHKKSLQSSREISLQLSGSTGTALALRLDKLAGALRGTAVGEGENESGIYQKQVRERKCGHKPARCTV